MEPCTPVEHQPFLILNYLKNSQTKFLQASRGSTAAAATFALRELNDQTSLEKEKKKKKLTNETAPHSLQELYNA